MCRLVNTFVVKQARGIELPEFVSKCTRPFLITQLPPDKPGESCAQTGVFQIEVTPPLVRIHFIISRKETMSFLKVPVTDMPQRQTWPDIVLGIRVRICSKTICNSICFGIKTMDAINVQR